MQIHLLFNVFDVASVERDLVRFSCLLTNVGRWRPLATVFCALTLLKFTVHRAGRRLMPALHCHCTPSEVVA